jgi:hypothetical protein
MMYHELSNILIEVKLSLKQNVAGSPRANINKGTIPLFGIYKPLTAV